MKHKKFTTDEINFLKKNFIQFGVKKCAEHLNRNSPYVEKKAYSLGLFRKNSDQWKLDKSPQKVNMIPFLNIKSPEMAYILGFIWADGHITKRKNGIVISVQQKDGKELHDVLLKHIPFNVHVTKRNGQFMFHIHDYTLHQFLVDNDYSIKSVSSPSKILSKIPISLRHYFFRGYFDGDGCFSNGKSGSCVSFTGSHNQNWNDTIQFIQKIIQKTPGLIRRKKDKLGHQSSYVYFYGKEHIKKFLSYLYSGQSLGLSRKRLKYEEFVNNRLL
jgi:intein-encoded DNA endonuclease-like protein